MVSLTGAVLPPESLREIATLAHKHNLMIVIDGLYEHLV